MHIVTLQNDFRCLSLLRRNFLREISKKRDFPILFYKSIDLILFWWYSICGGKLHFAIEFKLLYIPYGRRNDLNKYSNYKICALPTAQDLKNTLISGEGSEIRRQLSMLFDENTFVDTYNQINRGYPPRALMSLPVS